MAVGQQGLRPPPPVWPAPRGSPLFVPPVLVEVFRNNQWSASAAALEALSALDDRKAVQGVIRVTYALDGPLALVGRLRGSLAGLQGVQGYWLGLDAGHDAKWPQDPRGWHPVSARTAGGSPLTLTLAGSQLSLLLAHAITPPDQTGDT